MGRLLFSAICSLDGYINDTSGAFDWAAPSAEVHAHVNAEERSVGTYLYGLRMYQVMRAWQDFPGPDDPEVMAEYARLWRDADKVVFSGTHPEITTPRTRVESAFHPDEVRRLVERSERDVSIGGPTLAAHAFAAGLVEEVQLYLVPVSVGGGTAALPRDALQRYDLREQRRFEDGTVFLRYAVRPAG
jgi:dihydrofolate reductase